MVGHYIFFKSPKRPATLKWQNWGLWFSWLTGVFSKQLCHVAVIDNKKSTPDNIKIVHAWHWVKSDNVNDLMQRTGYSGYIVTKMVCQGYNHTKALKWSYSQSGKPYDVYRLIGIARVKILKLFGKNIVNKWNWKNAWLCSEFATSTAGNGGCPNAQDPENDNSPADFYEFPCHIIMRNYTV